MVQFGKILAAILCVVWLYKAIPFLVLGAIEEMQVYGGLRGIALTVLIGGISVCVLILPPINYLIEFSTGKLKRENHLREKTNL